MLSESKPISAPEHQHSGGASSSSSSSPSSDFSSSTSSSSSSSAASSTREKSYNKAKRFYFQPSTPFVAPPLPPSIWDEDVLLLNIGGIKKFETWINVNSQQQVLDKSPKTHSVAHVDVYRQMHDLVGFPDHSVTALYASHTLEHVSFGDGMLEVVLDEWNRVLKPGGLLLVSVPHFPTLASIYLDPELTIQVKTNIFKFNLLVFFCVCGDWGGGRYRIVYTFSNF